MNKPVNKYYDEYGEITPEQLDNIKLPKESENIKFRSTPTGKNYFYELVNKELVNKQLDMILADRMWFIEQEISSGQNIRDILTNAKDELEQSILDLIASEKVKQLEQLWNKTQPDIIPEGTPPLPIDGQIILDRIKELKENQDVSK